MEIVKIIFFRRNVIQKPSVGNTSGNVINRTDPKFYIETISKKKLLEKIEEFFKSENNSKKNQYDDQRRPDNALSRVRG